MSQYPNSTESAQGVSGTASANGTHPNGHPTYNRATPTTLTGEAFAYLERRWPVMPVSATGNKKPCIKWKQYQTELPDAPSLIRWWRDFPLANIGLITGELPELFVVEADSEEALAWLQSQDLPHGPVAQSSKSYKRHFYFKHPGFRVANSASQIYPNVDVRGDGGYVVLPPSVHHTGAVYQWIVSPDDAELPDAPEWLIEAIITKSKPERDPNAPKIAPILDTDPNADHYRRYAIAALEDEKRIIETAPDGQKHTRVRNGAISMATFIPHGLLSAVEVEDHLFSAIEARAADKKNARNTIRDGINYGLTCCAPRDLSKVGQGFGGFGGSSADDYSKFDASALKKNSLLLQHNCQNINNGDTPKLNKPESNTLQNRENPPENNKKPTSVEADTRENLQNLTFEPLLPLAAPLRPVPMLSPEMLPVPLRSWLADISERQNVPLEYPAVAAIVALSSIIGRSIAIRPKRYDEWDVICNLWGAIVGPPGVQKTPATSEAHKPLNRLVAEALEAHDKAKKESAAEVMLLEARADAAKKRLASEAKKTGTPESELRQLAQEAANIEGIAQPVAKRYVVNDTTIEALGERLKENPRGLLLNRDELPGFFKSLDKQGHESDRAFFLEAWNGTQNNYVYDRIGRGTVIIPSVTISMFGTIQPGPLLRYVKQAATGESADGLLPRFQMLVYPDLTPYKRVDKWPDSEAKNKAYEIFRAIDDLRPDAIGAQVEEGTPWPLIRFADDAQRFFDEWLDDLEVRVRSGRESTLMQGHLAKYRSLMPSLALIFHLVDVVSESKAGPVSLKAAHMAAGWCDYLEQHARRIYQLAYTPDSDAATVLADRLGELANPFRISQIPRKGWSKLTTGEEVRSAVEFLAERNYLRIVEAPATETGGRPTADIWINPAALAGDAQ